MSTVYSLIPERSLAAYSNVGSLVEVLCALIADPDEADDAAREYGVAGTPHNLSDFELTSGSNGVSAALQTVAEWAIHQQAGKALLEIAVWNRRVGVWCACQVARTALRFVPVGENRPRLAIETTERWVVGDATIEEVRAAASAAEAAAAAYTAYAIYAEAAAVGSAVRAAARSAAEAAAYAAYAEAAAVSSAARAAAAYAAYATYAEAAAVSSAARASAAEAAAYAAYAAARVATAGRNYGQVWDRVSQVWDRVRNEELVRLREVIANACMTFPR